MADSRPLTTEPAAPGAAAGIVEAVMRLTEELRSDREVNSRHISQLTIAIEKQGVQISNLTEASREQWDHIGKQRESIQSVAVEARATQQEKVFGKATREGIVQILVLMVGFATLISGPIVTFVGAGDMRVKNEIITLTAVSEARIESELMRLKKQTLINSAESRMDRAWRDRALRIGAQLAPLGVEVDWGELDYIPLSVP